MLLNKAKRNRFVERNSNITTLKAILNCLKSSFEYTSLYPKVFLTGEPEKLAKFSCQACFHLEDFDSFVFNQNGNIQN